MTPLFEGALSMLAESECQKLSVKHIVGFDPGGKNAFGWSVLAATGCDISLVASGTCSGAPEALSAVRDAIPIAPIAFGTDAPLFWVQAGDRLADKFVRNMVCDAGGQSGTVSHVNSLRGACLVQGVLVTRLAAELWPGAKVTEAHPKALLAASQAARDFSIKCSVRTEHERDAALAAYAAFAFISQTDGWQDLVPMEISPFFPGGKAVAYWFPKLRT